MLAAENWCLKVEDKVYGPYTTEQMRKFAHEGRLASWSLVSPAGGRTWREARNESIFANFFGTVPSEATTSTQSSKAFGKRNDCDFTLPEEAPSKTIPISANIQTKKSAEPTIANFVVIFDVVSGAASRVEAALFSLGPAFRIADNTWTVSCEMTAVGVRNAIAPYLRGSESIFVVDATRGRSSWGNYSPAINAKLTAAFIKSKQS